MSVLEQSIAARFIVMESIVRGLFLGSPICDVHCCEVYFSGFHCCRVHCCGVYIVEESVVVGTTVALCMLRSFYVAESNVARSIVAYSIVQCPLRWCP